MKIANKEYNTPTLDFGNMCKLEDWGIGIDTLSDRPLTLLGAFCALAIGGTLDDGKAAVDEHIKAGGKLDDLTGELNRAIESSGFFSSARLEG